MPTVHAHCPRILFNVHTHYLFPLSTVSCPLSNPYFEDPFSPSLSLLLFLLTGLVKMLCPCTSYEMGVAERVGGSGSGVGVLLGWEREGWKHGGKGRYHTRCRVTTITLRYVFAFSLEAHA